MLLFLGCDSYSGIWPFWDLSCKPGLFLGYLHLSNPWIPIFVLWKIMTPKTSLSSLDSQFLLSTRYFLKSHLVYEWLVEKSKMPWKEIILPFDLPSLWSSFSRICFSNPKCLTGHSTKPLFPQFSLRRIYCFLLRQYSSFTPIFPICLPIYIFLPYWLLFLRGKPPRWMWNSSPCCSLLGIISPEVFSVLTAF